MQTFLPYPDCKLSAKCLDYRRLGKQRLEAFQILNIITERTNKKGWRNHPAVRIWRGHSNALAFYMNCFIEEWIHRGYNNTMEIVCVHQPVLFPLWFGDDRLHSSHRSNLLRKDSVWYGKYGWTEDDKLPYFWPGGI